MRGDTYKNVSPPPDFGGLHVLSQFFPLMKKNLFLLSGSGRLAGRTTTKKLIFCVNPLMKHAILGVVRCSHITEK